MRAFLSIAFLWGTWAALPVAGEQSMERGAVITYWRKGSPLRSVTAGGDRVRKIRPGAL